MERIFIKEFNCMGYRKEVSLEVPNIEILVKVWSLETLELLLEKQIEKENFEAADFLKKEIDSRKK